MQSQRRQTALALASLLGPEVQIGLESQPFQVGSALNRLALVTELRGAQLLAADGSPLWSYGENRDFQVSQGVVEAGQYLATLQLNYTNPPLPLPLTLSWLAALSTLVWWRASGRGSSSLVLELDEKRRIRRLTGNAGLLSSRAQNLVGQSLEELLGEVGSSGRRLSELAGSAARSLVVVRDSQDIRKVRHRLKQLELQYRHLCDGAHDLIFILEPEGNLVFTNRALQHRVGTPTRLDQLFSTASRERVRTGLHDSLLEGQSGEFEAELMLLDGSSIPVSGTLSRAGLEETSPLTVLGIFRDLSAQRAAEARLAQAQKMEALGLLAGGVAHDFNNFLSLFSGLSALMRLEIGDAKTVEGYLDELDRGMESATDLTRQLLHFTHKKNPSRQKFRLDEAVEEFLRVTSRLLGRTVTIETSLQCDAELAGDRTQLDQIVLNLLINARDAMPQGGRLRLKTRRRAGMAELEVSDQGHGMTPEVAARIFEPYFTTKEPGKGTGLGLATVYAVVLGWGGEISVQSQPGQGTTFTVLLPLA